MVTFSEVRRWNAATLDGIEQVLKIRSDHCLGFADELHDALPPQAWIGQAANAAIDTRNTLSNDMEHLVAEVNATRSGVMTASDAVVELTHLVTEADGLAAVHGFTIRDDGTIVDTAVSPDSAADHQAAVDGERNRIAAELADRVSQILQRAQDIDLTLTSALTAVDHGQIPDGGATTLADAAAAYPGIPGPPPNPPVDGGAGEHGSDPWYTRADDLIKKGFIEDIAVMADGWGWTQASKHLRHYLDNSGEDMAISPDEIMRDVPKIRTHIDTMATTEMQRIAAEAQASGTYGQPIPFSSGWQGEYIALEDHEDWYYAMGGGQYAVTGVATVHPPEQPGGPPRVEMDYQAHVADRYNWDGEKSTEILGMNITDQELADLHKAGVAQEFNMAGSTETKTFTGTVPPPGQSAELPAPPDSRGGTRTDPGR